MRRQDADACHGSEQEAETHAARTSEVLVAVSERSTVVARHELGPRKAPRAVAANMGERRGRHVEDAAAFRQASLEVDVFEPELEPLVPAADGLEVRPAYEETRSGCVVNGHRCLLVQRAAPMPAGDRIARPEALESREHGDERAERRKPAGLVFDLRRAVLRIDETPGCRGCAPVGGQGARECADRLLGREDVVVQEQDQLGGAGLAAAVVGVRETLGSPNRDDADLRPSHPQCLGGPVDRAVVDDDHTIEQRGPKLLDAFEHQLARVSSRDNRVDHDGLIPSAAVGRLDANLRSGPQMLQYEALARRLAEREPGRLLDWGCGFGQVTALLRACGVEAVAFDYREGIPAPTIEPLERYPEIDAHLSPNPVELPFEDGNFDTVLSCGVLEHVQDPDASLDEIGRVLRPGGTFYVTNLPNRYSYTERIARLLGLYYHGQLPADRVYTKRTVRELLERHGFRVEELRLVHMLPLTLGGPARVIWTASRALERIPVLNAVATSLELSATAGGDRDSRTATAAL